MRTSSTISVRGSPGDLRAAGATFDTNIYSVTLNHLSGGGTITNSGPAQATMRLANPEADSTFSGVIRDGTVMQGPNLLSKVSVVKQGSGTLTLSGANTYTGTTTINSGTLVLTGSIAGELNVEGGTLTGTGRVARRVTVNAGGTLIPGLPTGTLEVSALTLNPGSTTKFILGAPGPGGGSDSSMMLIRASDQLRLTAAPSR